VGAIKTLVSMFCALFLGAGYGVFARWLIKDPSHHPDSAITYTFFGVSLAYLFLVPYALGVLTAALYPKTIRSTAVRWVFWLLMPCVSVGLMIIVVMALAWEGAICIVMASPIALSMGIAGGLTVAIFESIRRRPMPQAAIASCLVLPFAFGPAEARVPPVDDLRLVTTTVDIAAPPDVVWRNVVRVPMIADDEQRTGLFQRMGIPKPLEATITGDGVGALREARFAHGIAFRERVTEWQPQRQLGFTISADTETIPPDVLDVHVRVGGPYFDVVFGRFTLEPHGRGTRLHLESRHHLRTHLNFYAHLWTDAVMRDIQTNICQVIRRRAEGEVTP
jgi:hypothetical protein